jgi:hypothetical protein
MKSKKQFRSGIRLSKRIASSIDVNLIQKITGKYGTGKLISQFDKLVFRRYRRMHGGNNSEADTENNTVIKNYNNYFNSTQTNNHVLNYLTQITDCKSIKNNKEMPVPFNILRTEQLNNIRLYSMNEHHSISAKSISRIGITNRQENKIISGVQGITRLLLKTRNIYTLTETVKSSEAGQINEEIKKNLSDDLRKLGNVSDNTGIRSELTQKLTRAIADKQQPVNEALGKKILRTSDEIGLLLRTQGIKTNTGISAKSEDLPAGEKQQAFYTNVQRQEKLIHGGDAERDSKEFQQLNSPISKASINEKHMLRNSFPDTTKLLLNTRSIKRIADISENEITISDQLSRLEQQSSEGRISERINSIASKNVLMNRTPGFPAESSSSKENQYHRDYIDDNKNNSLEELQKVEKIIDDQKEVLLKTSATKQTLIKNTATETRHELIKYAFTQADGAISKIIKGFFNKRSNEKSAARENIYKNSTKLVPAGINRVVQTKAEEEERLNIQDLITQSNYNNLTLLKPNIQSSVSKPEQEKDSNDSSREFSAATVSPVKAKKVSINDIETYEVNLLADKIFKILEKRISIQKDRRGLR